MELLRLEGDELERTLAELVHAIVASLDPERILLFGSFARGAQNRASEDGVPHDFYDRRLADQALADLDAVLACVQRFVVL